MEDRDQLVVTEPRAGERAPRRYLKGITPRAIIAGAVVVAVLVATNPYLAFVQNFWTVGSGAILNGPIAALFLLVLLNGALKRFAPRYVFSRAELFVIYAMSIVCVGLVHSGGLPYILATTTAPFYFATPENQWQQLVWPYYPLPLQLSNLSYTAWFWQGAPPARGSRGPCGGSPWRCGDRSPSRC